MRAYDIRIWRALAIQLVGAVIATAAILFLIARARQLPLAVVLVGLTLAGALVVAAGQPWWRRIDEMERETHSLAWYEGSILGASVAMLWMLGLSAHTGAHKELALGGALCFIAQGVVYLIFWAIRWSGQHARALTP